MPATSSRDTRPSEGAIRDAVNRLARPDGEGGAVIERAAIVAEGADAAAIVAWILAHAGEPEAVVPRASGRGLHGARMSDGPGATDHTPRRYVLPMGALT